MEQVQTSTKHIVSMNDLDRTAIENIFQHSEDLRQNKSKKLSKTLRNKKLGVMFFQPSTRTRLNFEAAMLNLGGEVLGFSDIKTTRSGDFFEEKLEDAIRVVGQIVDCIVMRHFEPGSAKKASMISPVSIINGGDGSNEHPTQALIDLWMMHRHLGSLDGIRVGLVGDPSTRVLRSILLGLSKFKPKEIIFLPSPNVSLPQDIASILAGANIPWQIYKDISDLLKDVDVIEMLPIHLPNLESAEEMGSSSNLVTPDCYRLTKEKISAVGTSIPILHPGPRLDEMSPDVDTLPQTLYFKQVKEGVYLRMSLLEGLVSPVNQNH